MPNEFNANDIFEMAIKIEENGALFYRNAAEKVDGQENKQFLLDLAAMEDGHATTFAAMQKDLKGKETAPTSFDPENENALYLKALADARVFAKKEEPDNSFKSILYSAVQAEKDSIVFYLGMKGLVSEQAGKSKLDDIIQEEMSHIRLLTQKMMKA
jgi:rubrerythrin